MINIIVSMLLFALVGAFSPGPVNIIATGSGASFGFWRTLPHVLGATVAYVIIVLLAGLGMNELLQSFPQAIDYLRYIGGAFLIYMAWRIATSRTVNVAETNGTRPPRIIEGALSQLLNPKAWLVSMSGVSLFVAIHTPPLKYLAIFCTISFAVCFLGVGTWAAIGHAIQRYLSSDRRQAIFNIAMGLLLASTVVSMFLNQ